MANLDDDTPSHGGGGDDSDPLPGSDRERLEQRVRDLERENRRLREEIEDLNVLRANDQQQLHAHRVRGLPATKAEWDRMVAEAIPGDTFIRDLIAKLEKPE